MLPSDDDSDMESAELEDESLLMRRVRGRMTLFGWARNFVFPRIWPYCPWGTLDDMKSVIPLLEADWDGVLSGIVNRKI
jgi:hypothetical protein